MDLVLVLATSSVVAALVGAGAGYVTQRSLADRQARLDYDYAARRRLYESVGPLRFQLLESARDVGSRIDGHLRSREWNMDPRQYYVHSLVYRLLRPLAVCLLIERQMNHADFSVDQSVGTLLHFQASAYRMLTGKGPLPYYKGLDWATQSQHVFRDNLRVAATRLLVTGEKQPERVMDYAEFRTQHPNLSKNEDLAPLVALLPKDARWLPDAPVTWTRFVGYAYACQRFVVDEGQTIGFAAPPLRVQELMSATTDAQINDHLAEYPKLFDAVLDKPL